LDLKGLGYFNAKKLTLQKHNAKKCIYCGQLILRKISKVVATRCKILKLQCTKFDFRWDSAPDPTGELTALCISPNCIKVATSKGRDGKGQGRGRWEERGRKGRGEE